MEIRIKDSAAVCNARPGETILLACARAGLILSAPCGGRQRCGKCRVELLSGQVSGDTPDAEGRVRACLAVPLSSVVIAAPVSGELINSEVAAPAPQDRKRPLRAGVALDIGTTTVSAKLLSLDTLRALDTVSELNDQRVFGADVMSRIGAARSGGTEKLYRAINRQTERILDTFKRRWDLQKIEKLAVSGNTVMLHLFLNTDPSGMGELPFTPVFLDAKEVKGETLSLSAETVYTLPSIAAFIGGDISAGLTVLDFLKSSAPSLLVDVGTNGEMALFNKGKIFCCSTAAGPAFEGAEISCGMGGVKGAVSGVEIVNKAGGNSVSVTTIGNVPPTGICGSGLIDAAAVMLKLGIIDETGFMSGQGEEGYCLAPGVFITGRDIRQFQLAKSAILSGIRILSKRAGLRLDEIEHVFIAGGFGFFVNKQSAVEAGIFPREFLDRISVSGNLSLQGAEEFLAGEDFPARCEKIIGQCTVIDLASDPGFSDEFAENMLFDGGTGLS